MPLGQFNIKFKFNYFNSFPHQISFPIQPPLNMQIFPPSIWLLLIFLFLLFPSDSNAKKHRKADQFSQVGLNPLAEENAAKFVDGKCAFYCFFVPLKTDKTIDLHFYRELSCSDIVYGFAEVGDQHLKSPTEMDLLPHSSFGNFRLITDLQEMDTKPRVLLGMKMAPKVNFMDLENAELAANVSQMIVFHTRRYSFSGIFLKFDSNVLLSPGFEQFVEILADEIKNDEKQFNGRKLNLVLSISSNWVRYVYRRMPKFDAHFDAFYLWADEIDSAEELPIPSKAIPVDPLHSSPQVPHKDALAQNAERLAGTGVSRQKIIIGFSAWARSYLLQNASKVPPEVAAFGYPGEETMRGDGKLAFQEICSLTGDNGQFLDHDNISESVTLRDEEGLWISFNAPNHSAFIQKLDWVSNHEFGGVGLFSLQADDPNGNCSGKILPLHQTVANRFKCRRGTKRGNAENDDCTRVCILNMEEADNAFGFEQLDPEWCSHIVLGRAQVNAFVPLMPSNGMRRALTMYNDWERERKPFLILSFTATAEQWQIATTAAPAKFILIENIRRILEEHNADGVDLNCGNGGPEGTNHAFNFHSFLSDLRRMLGKRKQIMVSLHPRIFIEDKNYDFAAMARTVDYFIAIGYRFHHHKNANTGHHSPLFPASMLNQPKMTIQGMVETMLARQAPKEKIIVALSAQAMSQHFADDLHNHRSWEARRIGAPAARIYPRNRTLGPGVVSYTTVCELMKSDKTQTYFLSDLDVPYLINDEQEFIAFDDKRSIQIKTVWISLQGLAGIALHGLEMDNIGGQCPEGEPFPLLRTIAESQICLQCNSSEKGPMGSSTTEMPPLEIGGGESSTTTMEPMGRSFKGWGAAEDEEGASMEEEEAEWRAEELPSDSTSTLAPSEGTPGNCQASPQKDGLQNFAISCALPIQSIGKNLSIDNLPFGRCNSMILTGWAKLAEDGIEVDETEAEILEKLVEKGRGNGTEIWAEMSCEMGEGEWAKLIGDSGKREQFAGTLAKLAREKQLNGLLLDCDAKMRPSLRASFSQFLNEISAEFAEQQDTEGDASECISKLALKIQLSRTNIKEVYEPEQLNKLLRFVLLPSGIAVFKTKAKILNPLFTKGINSQENMNTQNATLANWLGQQLNAGLILMELPTFGIKQIRENGTAEPTIVAQNEICEFKKKSGVHQSIRYDAVAVYWKTNEEWLSAENGETITYKTQFAIQHQMGGIMLNSMDADDPKNECKNEGPFPMLELVHKSKCEKKEKKTTMGTRNNPRYERDMLGNMVLSRG